MFWVDRCPREAEGLGKQGMTTKRKVSTIAKPRTLPRPLGGKAMSLDLKNALIVVHVFDCKRLWFLLSRCRLCVVLAEKITFVEILTTWHP